MAAETLTTYLRLRPERFSGRIGEGPLPRRRCNPCATAAEENIALIRRGLDAFSRGDFGVALEDMHPDVEWHLAFRLPDLPLDKTVYHGPEEVRSLWGAFRSAWEQLTITLEEVVDAREDMVVVRARFAGEGRGSRIQVDRTLFYVFEIAAGKLKRLRPFDTKAEALAAADPGGSGPGPATGMAGGRSAR